MFFQALVDLGIAEHADFASNNFKHSKGLKLVSQSDSPEIIRMFKIFINVYLSLFVILFLLR